MVGWSKQGIRNIEVMILILSISLSEKGHLENLSLA